MPHDRSGMSGAAMPDGLLAADEAATLGAWDWDLRTDSIRAGAAAARLFDLPPMLAQGGVPAAVARARIEPGDRAALDGLLRMAAEEGCSYVAEYRVRPLAGPPRWVLERGRFHRDPQGLPWQGRGFVLDITPAGMEAGAYLYDGISAASHPLVRAAGHAVAAHRDLAETDLPQLHRTSDLLLFRIGRALARIGGG